MCNFLKLAYPENRRAAGAVSNSFWVELHGLANRKYFTPGALNSQAPLFSNPRCKCTARVYEIEESKPNVEGQVCSRGGTMNYFAVQFSRAERPTLNLSAAGHAFSMAVLRILNSIPSHSGSFILGTVP